MIFRILSVALLAFTLAAPSVAFAGETHEATIANPAKGGHHHHGPKKHKKHKKHKHGKKHGKKKAKKSRKHKDNRKGDRRFNHHRHRG